MLSTIGDIMSSVGGILSILSTWGYHDGTWEHIMSTVGVFSTMGENLLLFEYLHGTEHPHSTHDITPTCIMIPHGTGYPPQYSRYPPRYS